MYVVAGAGCINEASVKGTATADAANATDYKGEEGIFEWQFSNKDAEKAWNYYSYSE